ncbi:uncharacterized protein BP01DRAFT_354632 [Aspergillus saccharolyticus JOP 1030-1]|uniref:Uncharacterized protein n=1 Tax=Aspergillus saccharolyticus JOP 1030-1 TaxID=1450539 RepID=A0A318ZKQ0_9EURO|nr:hypothetical protein BP01DRAFT_354632 [Aspergillus saccharolyticus JOP 1030-1]PYH47437.1 hypothetical protein BP01DRAFT_354632 [Aspergillus saccharolyticus JOP 1030-1]
MAPPVASLITSDSYPYIYPKIAALAIVVGLLLILIRRSTPGQREKAERSVV